MAFSVGDKVRVIYNDNGDGMYVGETGELLNIDEDALTYPYKIKGIDARFSDEEIELVSKKGAGKMATKYYQVKKTTPMWEEGAILKGEDGKYRAISDLWDKVELDGEYLSAQIIEDKDNADFFERVYEVTVLGKAKYLVKDAAKEAHSKLHKSKD